MTADRGDDHHVRQLLGAHALGALGADERAEVSGHLRWCRECAEAYTEVADAVSCSPCSTRTT
ncbi:zf-HC2 domain-containing protein [Streptomyces sp. M10(2022)]